MGGRQSDLPYLRSEGRARPGVTWWAAPMADGAATITDQLARIGQLRERTGTQCPDSEGKCESGPMGKIPVDQKPVQPAKAICVA